MTDRAWYPYAPDQEFGVRIAADHDLLDQVIFELDARRGRPPRPANKAPLAGSGAVPSRGWTPMFVHGSGADGPITTAAALEGAVEMGRLND
jgi:hypothetical protein